MERVRSVAEMFRRALDSHALGLFTGMPARVVKWDPGSASACPSVDVAPVVRRPIPTGDDGEVTNEELPVIPNVPVMYPRGRVGGQRFAITWPLGADDHVWLVISIWSFDNWRRTGKTSDPGDLRNHSLGNCYAIPGAFPDTDSLDQAQLPALVLDGPEIRAGKDATSFVALADLVAQELSNIHTTLGSATAPVGGGPVVYGSPYSPGSVAATVLKAK